MIKVHVGDESDGCKDSVHMSEDRAGDCKRSLCGDECAFEYLTLAMRGCKMEPGGCRLAGPSHFWWGCNRRSPWAVSYSTCTFEKPHESLPLSLSVFVCVLLCA